MNPHNFIDGEEYTRQALLDFVGSKQAQSGVIWGARQPGCIICTSGGRHGKKAGYFDEPLHDGSWLYFGQGGAGDQSLSNSANSRLASGNCSVLLFTTREPTARDVAAQGNYGKRFKFQGDFSVASVETITPDTGPRKGDQLLRFFFMRAVEQTTVQENSVPTGEADFHGLRRRLIEQGHSIPTVRLHRTEYRKRSAEVRRYALLRANGICESCATPAPFLSDDEAPYLEVHHLLRLADDGPDSPTNVAAICPNCHRAVHYASNRLARSAALATLIAIKEDALSVL